MPPQREDGPGEDRRSDLNDPPPPSRPDPDESGGSTLRTWLRRVALTVVVFLGILVALYLLGVIGVPSAGLADRGDWGTVTDERTEVVTTVWVDNPNPFGVRFGDSVRADYDIVMNDVVLAEGSKSDIAIPEGNSTTEVRTDLYNDRLNRWWAGYVRADETVELSVDATMRVDAMVSASYDTSVRRTMLANATPVRDALSASINATSGTYTETVDPGTIDDDRLGGLSLGGRSSVTVGYEVRRGWATWGGVNASTTTIVFHALVHNPGDVPVPAAPDGIGFTTDANGVDLFQADTGDFSLRSVGPDALIAPGETREVTFSAVVDNDNVDEWFTSHVRNDERTDLTTTFQVVFRDPATGRTFRLPRDSPAGHECTFWTAILVDGQEARTTCQPPEGPAGPTAGPA